MHIAEILQDTEKRLHNSKIILAFHADIVYNAGNGMQEGVDP